jgi:hypothetical protein
MKIRGMQVVGDKLSKGEVTKKLFSMKMHGGLSYRWAYGHRLTKKQLDKGFAEMLERKAKTRPPMTEWTEEEMLSMIQMRHGSISLLSLKEALKEARKKLKTVPTKCQGTSRKKCPAKVCGKRCGTALKIWLGDYGKKKELLCPRCGWTTRAVTTNANGFRA